MAGNLESFKDQLTPTNPRNSKLLKFSLALESRLGFLGDMNELSTAEIAAQLRLKANRWLQMADDLEGKTVSVTKMGTATVTKRVSTPDNHVEPVTIEKIRAYMGNRSARISGLAKHFDCDPNHIHDLISQPGSGVIPAPDGRGWFNVSDKQAD